MNVATAGSTLDGATLIQVGLSNIQASVVAGGFGLTVTGGDLGLAIITAPTPATGTDSRYWIAVNGSGLAASLTLGGVTASVQSLDLQVNQAGGTDASNNPAVAHRLADRRERHDDPDRSRCQASRRRRSCCRSMIPRGPCSASARPPRR